MSLSIAGFKMRLYKIHCLGMSSVIVVEFASYASLIPAGARVSVVDAA